MISLQDQQARAREEFKKECKKGWTKWSTAATDIELHPFLDFLIARVRTETLDACERIVEAERWSSHSFDEERELNAPRVNEMCMLSHNGGLDDVIAHLRALRDIKN